MPERLDAYMGRANALYYAQKNPFADFTTAPEISQVFGELIGAWVAVLWSQLGSPSPVLLIEAGPGRGTLMADMLRAVRPVAPSFAAAAEVHFVETSRALRAEQSKRVPQAHWHARLEDVPEGPSIVIANEFLDALPIRQFVRRAGGWMERFVACGAFVDMPASPMIAQAPPVGCVVEVCEAALAWTRVLAARLMRCGGAALLIDYGTASSQPGDSLQALRGARPAHPLVEAGSADLTAHVDFAAVARVAKEAGLSCFGPLPQGVFLERLGLAARTRRLAATHPARAAEFAAARARLASPAQMGALFKVLCAAQNGCPEPAGFSE